MQRGMWGCNIARSNLLSKIEGKGFNIGFSSGQHHLGLRLHSMLF